jgi:hypothetical protein
VTLFSSRFLTKLLCAFSPSMLCVFLELITLTWQLDSWNFVNL